MVFINVTPDIPLASDANGIHGADLTAANARTLPKCPLCVEQQRYTLHAGRWYTAALVVSFAAVTPG